MCCRYPQLITRTQISNLPSANQLLIAKEKERAFALLKAMAASQISSSPDLDKYPALAALLKERKEKK